MGWLVSSAMIGGENRKIDKIRCKVSVGALQWFVDKVYEVAGSVLMTDGCPTPCSCCKSTYTWCPSLEMQRWKKWSSWCLLSCLDFRGHLRICWKSNAVKVPVISLIILMTCDKQTDAHTHISVNHCPCDSHMFPQMRE